MRHGDRIDQFNDMWSRRAQRPWDPPLARDGFERAWSTGRKLRQIGFPITRVVVSPFSRCLQTAAEVVSALASRLAQGQNKERGRMPMIPACPTELTRPYRFPPEIAAPEDDKSIFINPLAEGGMVDFA
ncbi:Histidine phosphatase superfamily (branch 1) [Carex littledalei]|uniref:Histidine phosphatase superfamily (Branch 1) n=1 Tax=Carex littledalei TaxID=544730 RepID=A0A833QJU8_9POAL|nr:Histidine phosphatase superfamily (branch 1) [Carex littledalei]